MLRTVLAVLALFALSPAAVADTVYRPPAGKEKAYSSYVVEVRKVLSAILYSIEGAGGAETLLEIGASGRVKVLEISASDDGLKERLRAKLASARVPPPPAWAKPPLYFEAPFSFR